MAKDTPDTPTKEKGGNSPFRKFEQLAKKIVRVPKNKVQKDKRQSQQPPNSLTQSRAHSRR